ncbi:hypothetical protein ACHAW6_014872 [Cyclotella cf. meneghiniana]
MENSTSEVKTKPMEKSLISNIKAVSSSSSSSSMALDDTLTTEPLSSSIETSTTHDSECTKPPKNSLDVLSLPTLQQRQTLWGILTNFQPDSKQHISGNTDGINVDCHAKDGSDGNDDTDENDVGGGRPSFSMTLAISPSDTWRLFDASREFNREIQKVREEIHSGMREQHAGHALKESNSLEYLLRTAASRSGHWLISTLNNHNTQQCEKENVDSVIFNEHTADNRKTQTCWDLDTGLLFLLDSDKSIKLLVAFDFLSRLEEKSPESIKENSDSTGVIAINDASASAEGAAITTATDNISTNDDNIKYTHTELKDLNEEIADRLIREDATTSKLLNRTGAITLFSSILSAISICVHGGSSTSLDSGGKAGADEKTDAEGGVDGASRASTPTANNKSPSSALQDVNSPKGKTKNNAVTADWKGSDKTQKEILDIATFAADNLLEFAKNEKCGKADNDTSENDSNTQNNDSLEEAMISFDIFGKWYNAGGFSLVPWLELLDLSKWDHHQHYHGNNRSGSSYFAGSSSKRSRPNASCDTPSFSAMGEIIGSPTSLFACGAAVDVNPMSDSKMQGPSPSPPANCIQSFSAMFGERNDSRTVVSFDFSGSTNAKTNCRDGFQIDVTEENLVMLKKLVERTGLATLSPQQVEEVMMRHAHIERRKHGETVYVISRPQYNKFIRGIVPKEASNRFDPDEIQNFSNYFTNFFTCFDYSWSGLKKDEVNAKELMVGFSFLCAGNKSTKLAAAYEMLDVERNGYLTQRALLQYLRSYLTMLAGISLLSSSKKNTHQIRKKLMSERRHNAFIAVENGAKWTLNHFLRALEDHILQSHLGSTRSNAVSFEDFAIWYTGGGYKIAPWLELLDLNKFLSLIGDSSRCNPNSSAHAEVLFTFPLANNRSLVVLRDDAVYVRSVVADLGLFSLTSEDIWAALYDGVSAALAENTEGSGSRTAVSANMEVDQKTFVQCMIRILTRTNKQKQNAQRAKTEETLKNLFLSFDMLQNNRVSLNQLMCGLTLLCGGKKSSKLVFAFGLFGSESSKNGKTKPSLGQEDFFYFFRSFLIVMFSCCNQSLDLSAEDVSKYISDTAKLVSDDVMGYWRAKKVNKVVFDQFSEWYNEGGYEIIPWLELLDLNKWVLADQTATTQPVPAHPVLMPTTPGPPIQEDAMRTPAAHTPGMIDTPASFDPSPSPEAFRALLASPRQHNGGLSAPPDGDPFFDLDMTAVDAEVDDMDFILQNDADATEHMDYENHTESSESSPQEDEQNALRFHLFSNDYHRGYIISITPNEVSLLHKLVTETGLCHADASTVCNFILSEAKLSRPNNTRTLSKRAFHSSMSKVCQQISRSMSTSISSSTQHELSAFLDKLFYSFDRPKSGSVNALEIACGVTVLCGGRKSDKLEHVFELFDEDKDSFLSQQDVGRFIQSFLVVLMSISSSISLIDGGACTNDSSTIVRAIESGSEWASSQVFEALRPRSGKVCFDDFADWYTKGGYQSIPWLELLDLNKWVLGEVS